MLLCNRKFVYNILIQSSQNPEYILTGQTSANSLPIFFLKLEKWSRTLQSIYQTPIGPNKFSRYQIGFSLNMW